jgi:hypothetical protein
MLGYIEEAGLLTGYDPCPHEDEVGKRRCRITAYALPEDSARLELFCARYVPPGESSQIHQEELRQLAGWPARFFEYAAKRDHARFKNNPLALAAAKQIASDLNRIEEVRIHVLTNGLVKDREVAAIQVCDRPVECSIWDLERLRRAASEPVTREHIEIDFEKLQKRPLSCLELKPPAQEYQTFLAILPGPLLCELYDKYGARLFEFNVRSFLQARGQVNKGIRESIRQQPDRFLAYNNGITATADEIEVGSFHGETVIRRLKGLQIVNGAQTTASIHWAYKMDKLDVSRVAVPMKLTRVEPDKLEEFVPLIARYANTQNPVQIADLSANSNIHIKLEQLAERVWCPGEESRWFYERARGAYQVARARRGTTLAKRREFDTECPKSQHFGKTDLAKYWMSWLERPEVVSKGAQKNFAAFMVDLRERYPAGWLPDEQFFRKTVALAILFKAAQVRVRRAKLQSYGANVVTYLIAKLAADHAKQLSLDTVWSAQGISDEMESLFDAWIPELHRLIVQSALSRNVTEWCKKEGCWEKIKAASLPRPDIDPPEFSSACTTDELTDAVPDETRLEALDDDLGDATDPVEICCRLDKTQWIRIIEWAVKSRTVPEFDLKVAHTIQGYSLLGWQNRPSLKQARIGLRVIEAAQRAGLLRRSGVGDSEQQAADS